MCKDCWFSKYNKVFFHYSEYCGGGGVYPSVSGGGGGGGGGGYASLLCGYGRVVPCLFLLCLNIASLLENSISHSGHVEDIS